MSRKNRKYERIEALFSRVQPIALDSPLPAGPGDRAGSVEDTQAQSSPGDTHSESFVPPSSVPPAGGRRASVNGIGQKMGFSYHHEQTASLGKTPLPPPENALMVPLMVSGKMIGEIQGGGNEAEWTAQEIETVSAVAVQLAQHLENLRFLKR